MLTKPDFMAKKIILFFPQNGERMSFKNDNVVIKDSEDKVKVQVTCYGLFAIFIVGGITLTSGLIERSKKFGFSIVMFSSGFKVYSTISYVLEGNTILHRKQYTTGNEVDIAKRIIINKIENQRDTIKKLRKKEYKDGIQKLDEIIEKLKTTELDNYEIMGFEGICSKVYFNRIFGGYEWTGRKPRVKQDKINLLMDIGYTVLFNYIEAILNIYGFDIYKGNLHREFYKRKSLVCDMIEPFRPIIDYRIRKAINLGQTDDYEFKIYNNQYKIGWRDSSKFVRIILEEINEYKENIFDFILQYYRWFMKGAEIEKFPKAVLYDNN